MTTRIPVAILGATGTVGQKFITLLADHPWFEIVQLAASAERVGKRYGDEVRWRELTPLPAHVADLRFTLAEPGHGARLAFSALDAPVARDVEPAFARAGVLVVSNASAFRMESDVPLLIPEVNAAHLGLIARQRRERGWSGAIIVNPNCSTAALVTAIAPLHHAFGLRVATVATLQAASGAGYPGVPALDLIGNVIPHIGGEEEKIEAETMKILGQLEGDAITPAGITVSAMVHRVPVVDGHLVSASLGFDRAPSVAEAIAVLEGFRGDPMVAGLPSSPALPIEVDRRADRPQSRLDLDRGHGMTVTVGRVRPCPLQHLRLVALGHNLVRGAAGAAVQNAELAVRSGLIG
ncbi:MAG: aspartate-semialdehyde dehydrogenase [Gemmatimonadota bacterium]